MAKFLPGVIFLSLLLISCSSPKTASEASSSAGNSLYPAWYSADRQLVSSSDSSRFSADGMAVAVDSAAAVEKAARQAASNLEHYLSSSVEAVRQEAAGENPELNKPEFIFSLRNAEAGIAEASSTSRATATFDSEFDSYRGFARAAISREDLVNTLNKNLATGGNAWGTLRGILSSEF